VSKILVIEDDDNIRGNVLDLLEAEGMVGLGAADGKTGIELAVQQLPALIVCDVTMPELDGYEVLETLSQRPETAVIPFIFLSARAERADVRKGMSLGADDYLTKPFTRLELLSAIRARLLRTQRRNEPALSSPSTTTTAPLELAPTFVVRDPSMRALLRQVEQVARGTISVLILGETGVGKEMVAELVHRASRRPGKFVAVNCAALPESLLESELFGHERGAFTGAQTSKEGLFESAHGGTLFLDEVGDMPRATQVKLLRVLETKSVTRVGGRAPRAIDVRFVSATNRDVERDASDEGTFRKDLYFRLNGVPLRVPALRERRSDIEALAEHFVTLHSRALGLLRVPELSAAARALLLRHDWPGNIRELRNVIERALLTCEGSRIEPEHLLVRPLDERVPGRAHKPSTSDPELDARARLMNELSEMEKQRIVDALARCAGNQTLAAELLGISRRTLVTRLHAYDLPRPRRRS